jgi:NADH:ubiquinone oxidoreductase subunit 4 (subunit M)
VGRPVVSREIGLADALALVPLVLIILVLAFYPQFGLKRSEPSVRTAVTPAAIAVHAPARLLREASR